MSASPITQVDTRKGRTTGATSVRLEGLLTCMSAPASSVVQRADPGAVGQGPYAPHVAAPRCCAAAARLRGPTQPQNSALPLAHTLLGGGGHGAPWYATRRPPHRPPPSGVLEKEAKGIDARWPETEAKDATDDARRMMPTVPRTYRSARACNRGASRTPSQRRAACEAKRRTRVKPLEASLYSPRRVFSGRGAARIERHCHVPTVAIAPESPGDRRPCAPHTTHPIQGLPPQLEGRDVACVSPDHIGGPQWRRACDVVEYGFSCR